MLVLGTGGAGAGGLVVREAMRGNDTTLIDCLERVSCARVFALAIIIACVYIYLFLLGATLGEISEYATSHTCYRARRG
jgi:branched-subunit amino acid permease